MTADQPGTGGDFELPGMWGSADLKGGWADSGSASEERLRAEVQAGRDDLHQLHQEAQRALAALQSQRDALARENADLRAALDRVRSMCDEADRESHTKGFPLRFLAVDAVRAALSAPLTPPTAADHLDGVEAGGLDG